MWDVYTDCLRNAKQSEELWSLLSLCAVFDSRVPSGPWTADVVH